MEKSSNGKPPTPNLHELFGYGVCATKYLSEFCGEALLKPMPVDIYEFVKKGLQLNVLEADITLPYISSFIVFETMTFPYTDIDCQSLVNPDVAEISNNLRDGLITINPGDIILNKNLRSDADVRRYMLAHESAHWIMIREQFDITRSAYSCCKSISERSDIYKKDKYEKYLCSDPDAKLEIMADGIANALLMPSITFVPFAADCMDRHGFYEHIISEKHGEEGSRVIREIASKFAVPVYAVNNRLYSFGMITNDENDNS